MKVPQASDIVSLPNKTTRGASMGRSKLIIKTGCKHTHFTWGERLLLQYYSSGTNGYSKITSPTLLGTLLSKSERTIRREIRRGKVEHTTSELLKITVYNAEYAQNDAESKNSAKGPPIKLGKDWILVKGISKLIKEDKYSPYAVIQHFGRNNWPSDTRICEKTLYNYIAAGDISNVTEKDLLYAGKRRKPKGKPKRHANAMNASRSIDKRPIEANDRSVAGHWEMDTVYSGKDCSPSCLLTLTERKTRVEIARKIPDRTASSVKKEIDKIERQIGTVRFRELFNSITPDNGVEFSNAEGLENSILCNQIRTRLFFAHPYSSYERGTNENHNGIIRKFIPKGSDIGLEKKSTIRNIQNWMNNYPRRILGGRSPLEALSDELGIEFRIPELLEVKT
ncbi:MAG: IS30 family transposase [Spirochaetia bacterium]|jgi:IS30 family transposase|nr:IS30 family transposase [Spirochaetia bacterium]